MPVSKLDAAGKLIQRRFRSVGDDPDRAIDKVFGVAAYPVRQRKLVHEIAKADALNSARGDHFPCLHKKITRFFQMILYK